jgi:hypothetical protein
MMFLLVCMGTGFAGYGYGSLILDPWVTHAISYLARRLPGREEAGKVVVGRLDSKPDRKQ